MALPDSAPHDSGGYYFSLGWKLIRLPGIRRFVILPLTVNIVLTGSAFIWLFYRLNDWLPHLMSSVLPDGLHSLNYLLWPLTILAVLLVFSYTFSTMANWIAAPFCGLLAEKLEGQLTGKSLSNNSWAAIVKDVPRMMKREWQKITWYLPRALPLLLLYCVPGIGQTLAPVLWFLFSAWTLAMQYCDYPFDNHRVDFPSMRRTLRQHRIMTIQFGSLVNVFTLLPFFNLVIMPVAVCGATAMWVDKYRAVHNREHHHYALQTGDINR
ncbi:sulfate transporter CysZ [Enterobacteriaceae bacterium LUAb1]